ncbi:hypothetical protein PNOK_0872500 [Pyrrhoderma noxium]|uniref:Uncharacterized protein n=1 Tax=Pyrrhoderma noxium TaxID=2282107 RepID=A0A286U8D1_9AGAM|nr:hypothetical protein PNOK_0872500 [Pyrrhoderma noxium]
MIPVRYVVRDMFEGVEPSIRTVPILAIFSDADQHNFQKRRSDFVAHNNFVVDCCSSHLSPSTLSQSPPSFEKTKQLLR